MTKKTQKLFSKQILNKIEDDIEEMEVTNETFKGEQPNSLSEYREANRMARWFFKTEKRLKKKKLFNRLPSNLQQKLKNLDDNEVVIFD